MELSTHDPAQVYCPQDRAGTDVLPVQARVADVESEGPSRAAGGGLFD
jgi:hypothetical protein